MERYTGATCPYCGKPFFDGDDVVVCPECGAPHHRACWHENGACAFSDRHEEVGEWRRPDIPAPEVAPGDAFAHNEEASPGTAASGAALTCPRCSASNPADGIFCQMCGAKLDADAPEAPIFGRYDPYSSPYGDLRSDDVIDGVPVREIALYVGENSGYFMPRFKLFSEGRVSDWNLSAFVFSYFYLFYRKMYALGILTLFATLVLSLPSTAQSLLLYKDYILEAGLLSPQFFSLFTNINMLNTFAMIANMCIWAMRGALMFFTNRLYYAQSMSKIHKIRKDGSDSAESGADHSDELTAAGHTNRAFVGIIVVGFLLLNMLSVGIMAMSLI